MTLDHTGQPIFPRWRPDSTIRVATVHWRRAACR